MLVEANMSGGGGGSTYSTTGTIGSTGTATVTCPFTPDVVIVKIQNGADWCVCFGGSSMIQATTGVGSGTNYIYGSPYGVSVSGNAISISTGLALTFNQPFDLYAMKL